MRRQLPQQQGLPPPVGPEEVRFVPLDYPGPYDPPVVPPPPQAADTSAERTPIFGELMQDYAHLFRDGEVGVNNLTDFLDVASHVSRVDYGDGEVYTGPGGVIISPQDEEAAGLLYAARTPDFWTIAVRAPRGQHLHPRGASDDPPDARPEQPDPDRPLAQNELLAVAKMFAGYASASEDERTASGVTEHQLDAARQRVARTLGIVDPGRFSLAELSEKIARRVELSNAVTAGEFDEQFAFPRRGRDHAAQADPPLDVAPSVWSRPQHSTGDGSSGTDARRRPIPDLSDPPAGPPPPPRRPAGSHSHRMNPKDDPERASRRRRILGVVAAVALTATVSTVLRAADVIPGGSIGVGAVTGAVGMMIATSANKKFWTEKTTRQKILSLGGAMIAGAGLGAGVALGVTTLVEHVPGWINGLGDVIYGDDGGAISSSQVPTTPPSPPPPPPPVDIPFDGQLQTAPLEHFTGVDGADNNPWLDNSGYDAIADRIDTEYRLATGHDLDWSTVDSHAYHELVEKVMEQNGKGINDIVHPGQIFTISGQEVLDFLRAQTNDLSLGMPKAV